MIEFLAFIGFLSLMFLPAIILAKIAVKIEQESKLGSVTIMVVAVLYIVIFSLFAMCAEVWLK